VSPWCTVNSTPSWRRPPPRMARELWIESISGSPTVDETLAGLDRWFTYLNLFEMGVPTIIMLKCKEQLDDMFNISIYIFTYTYIYGNVQLSSIT
jgi:hypothetical protein